MNAFKKTSILALGLLLSTPALSEEIATDGAPPPEEAQAISQDVANTVNPEAESPSELAMAGVIRLDRVEDGSVMIYKSGVFSDKVELVTDESGCWVGDGLAAHISFCSSDEAAFTVRGGPVLTCPHHSSIFFGPCEVKKST